MAKEDSINDEKKTPPPFKNKEEYIGGTNKKTSESNDSPSVLMVVQETWAMNIKTKKMKNTLKLHLNKMIALNQKVVKG